MNEKQSRNFGIKNFIRLVSHQFSVTVGVNLLMILTMRLILYIPASLAAGAFFMLEYCGSNAVTIINDIPEPGNPDFLENLFIF